MNDESIDVGHSLATSPVTLSDLLKRRPLPDEKLKTFLRVEWQNLYSNNKVSSPLYPSKVAESICLEVLKNWIQLELFFSSDCMEDSLHSGSNILITGTRGVGKTTLMTGLKAIIDVHRQNVRTIYTDYEQAHTDILISSKLDGFDCSQDLTSTDLDMYCDSKRYGIIFFGDEIQALYSDSSKSVVVCQILAIGKSHRAMGIISGSSSNVRDLVFKVDSTKYSEYPNLNNTVYKEKHLKLLRTQKEIQDALSVKKSNYSHVNPLNIFLQTGGVGRLINSALDGYLDHGDALIKKMTSDGLFFSVMSAIYSEYEKDEVPSWKLKHIPFQMIRELNAVHFINDRRDAGFIYLNDSYGYEFLIPNYLEMLRKYFQIPDKQFLLAFQTLLRGWKGHNSAGQAIEPYIIERYIDRNVSILEGKHFKGQYISFTSNPTSAATDKILTTLATSALPDLVNCATLFNKDTGIDAFIIESYANDDAYVHVVIIQIKMRERSKMIKLGKPRSTSSNEHLNAMLSKASNGFSTLSQQLESRFQRKFICSRFVLLTSKIVHEDVSCLETVEICQSDVPFTFLDKETFDEVFGQELHYCNLL